MGVGADAVYRINKYYIYTQDWYWPLRKRITKKLRKEKMHKENIIKNLDVIVDHMQYKQSSEFSETHREESEISEFNRAYKPDYVTARISTEHNYTELRANPDHPHPTRQGGRTPNSYNEEETNEQLNDEHFKEFTFTQSCSADYETQGNSGGIISDNYWAILNEKRTDEDLGPHGGLCESTSRCIEENYCLRLVPPLGNTVYL